MKPSVNELRYQCRIDSDDDIEDVMLTLYLWGGDRLCMDGSSPRKQREALRGKAWGRTSRICTAGRKMRFFYDLCDEFCTILDC